MRKVEYTGSVKEFIDQYDRANHQVWNDTTGEIVNVRKHIRDHYLGEQAYRCGYCRIEKKESHGMAWDIEHILPKSIFPEFLFEPENLAIACKECNSPKDNGNILVKKIKKNSKFPNESNAYTIVHPHFDVHSEHFEIVVLGNRRSYRMLNKEKARSTYILCNFSRFDFQYAEWDCFDTAIIEKFSEFLDRCPKDATPQEIKRMLGHMHFVENSDF